MSLKTADVLNDPLVKQTIAALEGKTYRSAPEQSDIEQNPLFPLLEKNGALDSVAAAALVADEMLRGNGQSGNLVMLLPPQVADVTRVLALASEGSGPVESVAAMLQDGSAAAANIGLTILAYAGKELDQMGRQRGHQEKQEMVREMADALIEATDRLSEDVRWKSVPWGVIKQLSEAGDTVAQTLPAGARKRLLQSTVQSLQTMLVADGMIDSAPVAPVVAAQPGFNPSLQLNDVFNDPLVQETMTALGVTPADVDLTRTPPLGVLARANTLDSVTAASLIALEHRNYNNRNALPAPVRATVDALNNMNAFAGLEAMFASDSHTMHKIGLVALTMALDGGEFSKMQNQLSGREFQKQLGEVAEASLYVVDRLVETKSWQSMSPEFVDSFTKGLDRMRSHLSGHTLKKLVDTQAQLLKAEIARANAATVTAPQPRKPAPPKPKNKLKPT